MRKAKVVWNCLQALSTLAWTLTTIATLASGVIAYALVLPLSIIALVPTVVFVALSGGMAWRQSRSGAASIAFDDAVAEVLAGGPVLTEETLIELTDLARFTINAAAMAADAPPEERGGVVSRLYEDWYEQGQPPQVT